MTIEKYKNLEVQLQQSLILLNSFQLITFMQSGNPKSVVNLSLYFLALFMKTHGVFEISLFKRNFDSTIWFFIKPCKGTPIEEYESFCCFSLDTNLEATKEIIQDSLGTPLCINCKIRSSRYYIVDPMLSNDYFNDFCDWCMQKDSICIERLLFYRFDSVFL